MYKSVVILHGIGDFIAIEPFLTDAECNAVETIYWASAHRKFYQNGLIWNQLFPNLKEHKILFDDWGTTDEHAKLIKRFKVDNKHDLIQMDPTLDPFWISQELLDAGLPAMFDGILYKQRRFQRSRIAEMSFKLPPHINLPDKFVLIHPWSDALRTPFRDFADEDWEGVLGCLEKNNLTGVVVNKSKDLPPQHPKLIDLTNQVSLQEVFAIAKQATYFMGAASFLHCFMPKILPAQNIFIRSRYPWLEPHRHEFKFYHAPLTFNGSDFKLYSSLNFLKDYTLA